LDTNTIIYPHRYYRKKILCPVNSVKKSYDPQKFQGEIPALPPPKKGEIS